MALTDQKWNLGSPRIFSNLAVLATSEQRAISLWRSIRSWGATGEMEAHYISEMKILFPGLVDEVMKSRPRPTHLAALAARGRELSLAHRRRLCQSRQPTVTRVLAANPWIAEMTPEDRLNLIFSKDPQTRTLVVSASFLPHEERLAALRATDADGTPWYEVDGMSDPISFGWPIPASATMDLPLAELVASHSPNVHNRLINSSFDLERMSADTKKAWFSQLSALTAALSKRYLDDTSSLSSLHSRIMFLTSKGPSPLFTNKAQAISTQITKDLAEEAERSKKRPWAGPSSTEIAIMSGGYAKLAEVMTGPPEDTPVAFSPSTIESGSLTAIADRHAFSPITPDEAVVIARRTQAYRANAYQHAFLPPTQTMDVLAEMKISSEAAVAFYRELVALNSYSALSPSEEFVKLMSTRDAANNLLVPVALTMLSPDQLLEVAGPEGNDLWHEMAALWPDTLGSLFIATDD